MSDIPLKKNIIFIDKHAITSGIASYGQTKHIPVLLQSQSKYSV